MSTERDRIRDAIANGRDRGEEIRAEWEALGMEPRVQSPAEMRRVLLTWSKAELVEFVIRAESDELKMRRKQLEAWAESQRVRAHALVLPREAKAYELGYADPFNGWLITHKGQTLDAKDVFLAGWTARRRAEEALSDDEQEGATRG